MTDTATQSPMLVRALRGEATPRRPLWIMRQAGRFLPEYRNLRSQHDFLTLAGDPDLAAQVTLLPFERFELDGAIIFADLMSPVAALGLDVRFAPGPVLDEPIRTAAQVQALPHPDPSEVAPEVAQAILRVRASLPASVAVLGFAGAPLSIAAYLVEGGGSRGAFAQLRALAYGDEPTFHALLERLTELCAGYLREQIRAGADAIQIFESWAGLFPLHDWERLVRPHLQNLLRELDGCGVPRILFLHGGSELALQAAALGPEALALDWRSDLGAVRAAVGPEMGLQGNLDPAVLLAGPEATAPATRELLQRLPARGHVVNLGHGITPNAPLESVSALIETVRAEPLG